MTNRLRRLSLSILLFGISFMAAAQSRPRVGLVLGGGGAKGAAEAGALKVIEEAGVPIDMIAGTSIGSIVGGMYSIGYRSADLDSLFSSQNWLELFGKELLGKHSIINLLDTMVARSPTARMPWRGEKNPYMSPMDFDKLPIPFRCVATDLRTQTEVVLDSGRLAQCMRASMAIPGVFSPVRMDGKVLIDGGAMNNLPVDVARNMGADIVIAIDLTQNKHDDHDESSAFKTGIGLIDWFLERPDISKYNRNRHDADIYINPNLKGFDAASFTPNDVLEMMKRGEKAARKHWSELKALAKRMKKAREQESDSTFCAEKNVP
ncbi:MAG: patatin-like phospholipase family protein [Prevotella sp.]|nr:patatin-like phospholipase family protein [Prevotella sp.]